MKRRGYEIFVGKQDGREVDLVGIRREEKIFVQVTYLMELIATGSMSLPFYWRLMTLIQGLARNMDSAWRDDVDGVRCKNIVDFLLDKN